MRVVAAPRGARPRKAPPRPRLLAALSAVPATAAVIAELAGTPGRERAREVTLVLLRLEAGSTKNPAQR